MSQEAEAKCPCSSCGGNVSFPISAQGMMVNCPHCGQETILAAIEEVDDAVAVTPSAPPAAPAAPPPSAPVVQVDDDDDAVVVAPSVAAPAPPPPAPGGGRRPPPPPKKKIGAKLKNAKRGAAPPPPPPPPPAPPPPPSDLKATAKPPPPPLAMRRGPRRRPGILARSSAGVGGGSAARAARNRAMGIEAAWDDDEIEDPLKDFEKRCNSCGRKYEKGAIFCPTCKEVVARWLVWLRRFGWLVVLGLAVLAVMNYRRLYPPGMEADGPAKSGVEMLSANLVREKFGDLTYIRGVVTNHSPVDLFYVKVEFDLIDNRGKVLGTVGDQLNVISSNAVWNYKALVLDPDAVRYINPRVSAVR